MTTQTDIQVPQGATGAYGRSHAAVPADLVALLVDLTGGAAPHVVDLGAGTGLSCRPWRGRARNVTAVEPDAKYRELMSDRFAEEIAAGRFEIVGTSAETTGLPDNCADIVTACGSLHWFDLDVALKEVGRILRPGGVFAVCNASATPLVVNWAADRALRDVVDGIKGAVAQYVSGNAPTGRIAALGGRRQILKESGQFREFRTITMHSVEEGTGDRARELVGTFGAYRLLRRGADQADLRLRELRRVATRQPDRPLKWDWSFQIILALR